MPSPTLRRAYAFHREHSGYVVGENARCAIALARAELALAASDAVVVWEPDDDTDWSFIDTWPEKDARAYRKGDHYAESCAIVRPCPEHGVDCPHAEYLASLGGIIDADTNYRRTIAAELASEALANLEG